MSSEKRQLKTQKSIESSPISMLPQHVLENILSFVISDFEKLSLVCKYFYEIVCKIREDKLWLRLTAADIADNDCEKLKMFTEPIENCQIRKLRNFELVFSSPVVTTIEDASENFWKFLEIQGKFIKNLTVEASTSYEISRRVVSKMSNLSDFQLSVYAADIEPLDLCHMKNLKNLSLCLFFDGLVNFKKIKISENLAECNETSETLALEKLSIEARFEMDEPTILLFSKMAPNLKELTFKASYLYFDYQNVLANFKKLEKLNLFEYCDGFRQDSYRFYNSKVSKNENLKSLTLNMPLDLNASNCTALTENFTNLTYLRIFIHNQERKSLKDELKILLEKFRKMEVITIYVAYTFKLDFPLHELIVSMTNVKYLSIRNFDGHGDYYNMEILKSHFGFVELDCAEGGGDSNGLVVAADQSVKDENEDDYITNIQVSTRRNVRIFV